VTADDQAIVREALPDLDEIGPVLLEVLDEDDAMSAFQVLVARGYRIISAAALVRLGERAAEDQRKIDAYDAARAQVKTEGNSRAYYVLRAEAAEAEVVRLGERARQAEDALREISESTIGVNAPELRIIARAALRLIDKGDEPPFGDGHLGDEC
jgi:hypothetical protein